MTEKGFSVAGGRQGYRGWVGLGDDWTLTAMAAVMGLGWVLKVPCRSSVSLTHSYSNLSPPSPGNPWVVVTASLDGRNFTTIHFTTLPQVHNTVTLRV